MLGGQVLIACVKVDGSTQTTTSGQLDKGDADHYVVVTDISRGEDGKWIVHLTNSMPGKENQDDWNQEVDWDTFLNAFTDHGNGGYDAVWVDVPPERFDYVDETP